MRAPSSEAGEQENIVEGVQKGSRVREHPRSPPSTALGGGGRWHWYPSFPGCHGDLVQGTQPCREGGNNLFRESLSRSYTGLLSTHVLTELVP